MRGLWDDIRTINASRRALRLFGLVIGVTIFLAALGVALISGSLRAALVLGVAGTALVFPAWIAPQILRPVYMVWMALGLTLGHAVTQVRLTVVFFLIVIPTGLLMRFFGRDPMYRKPDQSTTMYWIKRERGTSDDLPQYF